MSDENSARPKEGREWGGFCVISRKVGQSIQIGDVLIYVVSRGHGHVQLAVRAPKDLEIKRLPCVEIPPEKIGP